MTVASAIKASEVMRDISPSGDWNTDKSAAPETLALRAAIIRVEALDLKDLRGRLDATMQAATVREVAVRIALGVILLEEVGATQPSVGALEAAIRQLIRTEKFLPTISEVLQALAEAEHRLSRLGQDLYKIPERLERSRALFTRMERTPAEIERDRADATPRGLFREVCRCRKEPPKGACRSRRPKCYHPRAVSAP